MAEYEKSKLIAERDRLRSRVDERTFFEQKRSFIPPSQQTRTTATTSRNTTQQTSSPQQNIVLREEVGDGIGLFKDVAYANRAGSEKFTKVYDSSDHDVLRDVLFVNRNTTVSLTFAVLLSRIDIDNIQDVKQPNLPIEDSKDTVYLAVNMLLAQAGQAPSNPKQLSLSEIVGTTQKFISGNQKPFYIYVYKTAVSDGILDVTVLR